MAAGLSTYRKAAVLSAKLALKSSLAILGLLRCRNNLHKASRKKTTIVKLTDLWRDGMKEKCSNDIYLPKGARRM